MMMILSLFMVCGTSIKVTTDFDKSTDFTKYKTYNFVEEVANLPMNDVNKNRLLKSIENELSAKDLTKAKNPDLVVDNRRM